MFLAHCVMEWIVLTVLSLCLPVWSAVKVIQPYRVVSTNGTAQVQCFIQPRPFYHQIQPPIDQSQLYPYPSPEELRVTLLKGLHGTEKFCSSILNYTEKNKTGVGKEEEVQCFAHLKEGAVEVTVSGLQATDTDIYRCQVEVFYPPPYLQLTGNGTLIHVLETPNCPVQGAHRQTALQGVGGEVDEGEEKMEAVSVPVVVLVILVMFVLIIIIYFQPSHLHDLKSCNTVQHSRQCLKTLFYSPTGWSMIWGEDFGLVLKKPNI
ncbi:Cytotoxic T-lymphocyte protein 4 [Collichthys lucidus]|uniref:Cytotoxic T-lymphocyte protein 4 n=1 Tax=Collichthys lucidus TaxID=240159 RepID=A0A4U5U1B9_COLLU|nr:Cytotoxic T-lymphocyte protein 4 [Collichthys lucidus]